MKFVIGKNVTRHDAEEMWLRQGDYFTAFALVWQLPDLANFGAKIHQNVTLRENLNYWYYYLVQI